MTNPDTTLTGGTAATDTSSSGAFFNPRKTYDLTVVKRATGSNALIGGAVFELYRETGTDGPAAQE